MAQPTIGGAIPQAGGPELHKKTSWYNKSDENQKTAFLFGF